MEFVHRPYIPGETIAALATAPGEAGIAIIRISGNNAVSVAEKIFSKPVSKLKSHTVHYGKIILKSLCIDDVILLIMRAPRSFTGEDTVEIHCHGGLVSKQVLEACIQAGAKPASPGEFSFKAFINGKMDLAQAEAIQSKIAARNEVALNLAQDQLEGRLSKKIGSFQSKLIDIAAIFEAWVDFPEEDLEFAPFDEVIDSLQQVMCEVKKLITSFEQGKIAHDGVTVSLIGSPNVGKSSLMNALLGKDRAIVSPIAGTTRDLVEDDLRLNNLHLRLVDTAGIRDTSECIEEEGIRRSKQASMKSDIILYLLDVTSPELVDIDLPKEKTILVWNKIDLPHERPLPNMDFDYIVELSAQNGSGMTQLQEAIDSLIWKKGAPRRDEVVITSLRHKDALVEAYVSFERVVDGLKRRESAEFVAFDMRAGLQSLGTIIGSNITEDILTSVFSKFCIGK
ncbi:MAG: tRNA uridine-5-carboxymethylaminomethyl(34) synthesis GTPase MnmE [Verrucomicrobia bacterium]|nr:tRNA uridine-5-carboxymethylaminomethyl(34) synthesis GTPase MnmE [Verrucomicrobiota bacterium]MBS0637301.1 tRNA uridine-5-carboxymethylaminomethyl(34) synthesis GTPase MnmE [Verrucomicrobiota bacterium]